MRKITVREIGSGLICQIKRRARETWLFVMYLIVFSTNVNGNTVTGNLNYQSAFELTKYDIKLIKKNIAKKLDVPEEPITILNVIRLRDVD